MGRHLLTAAGGGVVEQQRPRRTPFVAEVRCIGDTWRARRVLSVTRSPVLFQMYQPLLQYRPLR